MVDWLMNNIPLISGITVAFLSFLTSFIKFLNERDITLKGSKVLKSYADIYSLLPDGTSKQNIKMIIEKESNKILERSNRKLNVINVVAAIVVTIMGGSFSYLFVLWAVSSNHAFWTVVAWILFAVSALFTIGLSIAGLASIYEIPKQKNRANNS